MLSSSHFFSQQCHSPSLSLQWPSLDCQPQRPPHKHSCGLGECKAPFRHTELSLVPRLLLWRLFSCQGGRPLRALSASSACPASWQSIILVDFLCCCCLMRLLSSPMAHSPSDPEKQEQIRIFMVLAQDVALQPPPEVMFPKKAPTRHLPHRLSFRLLRAAGLSLLWWESLDKKPTWRWLCSNPYHRLATLSHRRCSPMEDKPQWLHFLWGARFPFILPVSWQGFEHREGLEGAGGQSLACSRNTAKAPAGRPMVSAHLQTIRLPFSRGGGGCKQTCAKHHVGRLSALRGTGRWPWTNGNSLQFVIGDGR